MQCVIFVTVLLALVHRISAGGHGKRGRIYNGQDALDGQFDYIVGIVTCKTSRCTSNQNSFCGGTLIALNWVLTAAHCLYEKETAEIFLGATDREEAEISYTVKKNFFKLHPKFSYNPLQNDIAFIQIPKVKLCNKIDMVWMPQEWTNRNFTDEKAIAIGWGAINDDGDLPERLQWVQVKVITNELCKEFFPNDILDTNLCVHTQSPYGSTCSGDSGGPLVLFDTDELIGVVSAVPLEGCDKGKPAIFARITSYMLWITKETGIFF